MTDHEHELRDFLAPSGRSVDYTFAQTVRRRVLAEEAMKAARRSTWAKFGRDLLASGAIVVLLMLLGSQPGLVAPGTGNVSSAFSPLTTLVFIFGIWTLTGLSSKRI